MTSAPALPSTVVVLLAVSLIAPAAGAANLVKAPPDESGLGRTDVRDEPNHVDDRNGFEDKTYPSDWFDEGPELVLESLYRSSTLESSHDHNNLLRVLVEGVDSEALEHEDRITPGQGYFFAYWGWWWDRGGGAWLPGAGAVHDGHDGRIDDAHDDRSTWDEDPRMGEWDEFLWRGVNPWVDDHPFTTLEGVEPTIQAYPDDEMHLFIQPGTHHPREGNGLGLTTGADDGDVADASYQDDTAVAPYESEPVRQKQGWDGAQGYDFTFTDQSLLVATEATTAVNPDQKSGTDRYDVSTALRVDVDTYAALAPEVETLYRTAVWDPGDEEPGPADDTVGEEGLKGELRGENPSDSVTLLAQEAAEEATYPLAPAVGAADDTVKPPRPHEPNHPGDRYGRNASYDPATSYGDVDGPYYDPGEEQTYDGYQEDGSPWLDAQPGYGVPAYAVLLPFPFNFNAHPAPNLAATGSQGEQRTQAPGFLFVTAELGLWWDANEDGWIGRLDDPGRRTRPDDPYRGGEVDDPNDYADTPANARSESTRQGTGEWRPLCQNAATLEGTLRPDTDDGRWGEAGVYVVQDEDEPGYNPWDDAVGDAVGTTPATDDDGERFSRHVQEGPIPFSFKFCSKDRGWTGNKMILTPTGTAGYDVLVTMNATIDQELTVRPSLDTVEPGTRLTDVDAVHDWGVPE